MHIFADPIEGLQVAKPPLALFHIGLNDIAAVAHPFVTRIAFGQFLAQELLLRAAHDIAPKALRAFVIKRFVTPDIAPLKLGRADRQILFAHADCIADCAAGMTNFQAQIPQQIEHCLDHLFAPRRASAGRDKGDVDIGMRRHFCPPISAHRHNRDMFARGGIGSGIEMGCHMVINHANKLIDQKGLTASAFMARRRVSL